MSRARAIGGRCAHIIGSLLTFARVLTLAGCNDEPTIPPALSASSSATTPPPLAASSSPVTSLPLDACDAGDRAFVRRALFELTGRRPYGQGEVNAAVDVLAQLRAWRGNADDLTGPRRILGRALMEDDGFSRRWSEFFKDALHVARTETKSLESCYGETAAGTSATTVLAAYVRDHEARAASPPVPNFTLKELLPSAMALDDLSVLYRANLLAMMSRPFVGNSTGLELELTRRNDFGTQFEATYTGRDVVCLGCHNSQYSVTSSPDPARNRFWPIPGLFELALFGASTGAHPPSETALQGSDVLRARGMFRVMGVTDGGGQAPFGWDASRCGTLAVPQSDDPLGVDTYFGSVRSTPDDPGRGLRASVWDLEGALHRGVDALADHGLTRLDDGTLPDPDEAFAYLTAATIVEKVWIELLGTPLTIAHHFPRSQAQRDILVQLTDAFVRTHFSLKGLLLAIVVQPAFNLASPRAGCGSGPYPFDRVFDPWTDGESDAAARGNGPSDAVHAVPPRLLRGALHRALGWPDFPEYPASGSDEEKLQLDLGFFLRDAAPGHRELDFQGRLVWEANYGGCPEPAGGDFISALIADAVRTPGVTLGDGVRALKDRLLGDPGIDSAERSELEALLGMSFDTTDFTSAAAGLRRVCGALVASPGFLLDGIVPPAQSVDVPRLTPAPASYGTSCALLSARLNAVGSDAVIDCDPTL